MSAIDEFSQITGCDHGQAQFYLDAAGGDLERAVEAFYESGAGGDPAPPESVVEAAEIASSVAADMGEESESNQRSTTGGTHRGGLPIHTGSAPRIATIRDEPSDPAQPPRENQYFAGGSRSSGQMIQGNDREGGGPSARSASNNPDENEGTEDHIAEIMRKATEGHQHPEDSDEEPMPTGPSQPAGQVYFTGAAYRLGSEEEPGSLVQASSSSNQDANDQEGSGKVTRTLTFWKEGFTIDDGELQSYDDPQSRANLEAIRAGRAPVSLLNVQNGQPVDLVIRNKRQETYQRPPVRAFSGKGQRLGAVVPAPSGGSSSSSNSQPQAEQTDNAGAKPLEVDEGKEKTRVQVRLANGQRMVVQLNLDHTIADLRAHINAQPSQTNNNYVLQTTFPNRILEDESVGIGEAGIAGSVVFQKVA